jgi:hypothetical protein
MMASPDGADKGGDDAARHADTLAEALPHYNGEYRHRFWLPSLTLPFIAAAVPEAELFADLDAVKAGGIDDASCAIIARRAARLPARYASGVIARDGVSVVGPHIGEDEPYLRGMVLLANPVGSRDNWLDMSRWFHKRVEDERRSILAGMSSEVRRDYSVIDPLLRASPNRAVIIPPSEAFSVKRATEVSFIFDVEVETLRKWKRTYRPERAAGKPGAPRKNR